MTAISRKNNSVNSMLFLPLISDHNLPIPSLIVQDHDREEGVALRHHLLHPERPLRRGQLGILPHTLRRHSGEAD